MAGEHGARIRGLDGGEVYVHTMQYVVKNVQILLHISGFE